MLGLAVFPISKKWGTSGKASKVKEVNKVKQTHQTKAVRTISFKLFVSSCFQQIKLERYSSHNLHCLYLFFYYYFVHLFTFRFSIRPPTLELGWSAPSTPQFLPLQFKSTVNHQYISTKKHLWSRVHTNVGKTQFLRKVHSNKKG